MGVGASPNGFVGEGEDPPLKIQFIRIFHRGERVSRLGMRGSLHSPPAQACGSTKFALMYRRLGCSRMALVFKQQITSEGGGRSQKSGSRLASLCLLYLAGLFAWYTFYRLFGDGKGYLGLANAVSIYFFAPLPLALIVGVTGRHRGLLLGSVLGVMLFGLLWGLLF